MPGQDTVWHITLNKTTTCLFLDIKVDGLNKQDFTYYLVRCRVAGKLILLILDRARLASLPCFY